MLRNLFTASPVPRVSSFFILCLLSSWLLVAAEELKIERIRQRVYSGKGFAVALSSDIGYDVDEQELAKFISIAPETPFSLMNYSDELLINCPKLQPATCYTITIKEGFPGKERPSRLAGEASVSVITRDEEPDLDMASRGTFFPLHAPIWELPFTSINVEGEVRVSVSAPYGNRIVDMLCGSEEYNCSHVLSTSRLTLKPRRNQRCSTSLDLEKAGIPRGKPGIYCIELEYHGPHDGGFGCYEAYRSATATAVVTDMALFVTASDRQLLCQVRRLSDPSAALPEIRIQAISSKRQTLCTGTTGADGCCHLTLPVMADDGDYPAVLIARNPADGDIAFISLRDICTSCHGNYADDVLTAAFAERGIARPGEEMGLCASLRYASTGEAVPELPLEVILRGVNGVEIGRKSVRTDGCGLAYATVAIPKDAALGSYSAVIRSPGAIEKSITYCSTGFLVSDFIPDQLEGTLDLRRTADGVDFNGHIAYYFGKPLDNVALTVKLTSAWDVFQPPEAYKGYCFDSPAHGKPFSARSAVVTSDGNGDFGGKITVTGSDADMPARPVKMLLQATPKEAPGVRPITIRAEKTIHYRDSYVGVKTLDDSDSEERHFALVALTPEGKPVALPGNLGWKLLRVDWRYLLQESSDGVCRREWMCVENEVASGIVNVQEKQDSIALAPPQPGQYALVLWDSESGQKHCRTEFWHWGGESAQRSPNPTMLDFNLDKEEYRPGETAKVAFAAGFEGQALVVCGNGPMGMTTFCQPVHSGLNTLNVPVPADAVRGRWFADVTVVGVCGTGEDGRPEDAPHLHGTAVLRVAQIGRILQVALQAPELCEPGAKAHMTLTLKDAEGNAASGEAVVWGVDEGILALTAYKTPQLQESFFGDMSCPLETRDIYSAIYPLLRVVNGKIGGGYDAANAGSSLESSLKKFRRERLGERPPEGVIRLGIISVGESGEASVDIDMPKESGALRLMAAAASKTATGSAEHRIVIRSAATAECLAPQSVAPGDSFILQSVFFNHAVPEDAFTWECLAEGAAAVAEGFTDGKLQLQPGERASVAIPVTIPPEAPEGVATIRLTVKDESGKTYVAPPCTLQIRPATCTLPQVNSIALAPGESRRFDFQPGEHGYMEVGTPLLQLRRHWQWLNDYPYGCLEQTIAAAFPQLAVPALVQLGMLPESYRDTASHKVENALARLATMRCGDYYSMWPKGEKSWVEGSLFAFLFQLEAARCGFDVPAAERRRIAFVLRRYLNDRSNPPQERALATYALSLAAPELAAEYVKMLPLDETSPRLDYMRFLASMALLRGGFAAEGNALRRKTNLSYGYRSVNGEGPLDTPVRSIGLCLWLMADLLPEDPELPRLAAELQSMDEADGGWFTTHEHAWAALGLSQYLLASHIDGSAAAVTSTARYAAKVKWPVGAAADATRETPWSGEGLSPVEPLRLDDIDGTLIVENCGDAPLMVHSAKRVLQPRTSAVSNGLSVTREYFSEAGLPVNECQQGDLLEVRIRLAGNAADSLVLCDLLPGGFEIEDPQLMTRAAVPTTWSDAKSPFTVKRAERLYDRLLVFGDFRGCAEPTEIIRYHVRAVAAGSFSVPQIQAEAMYNPRDTALSAAPEEPFVIHAETDAPATTTEQAATP